MVVLRRIARPLLASMFVYSGWSTFRHAAAVAPRAARVVSPLAERVPALPDDPEQAVRINGAVHVVAGGMLGIGVLPRISAVALAVTLVPTTLAGHPFWTVKDEEERQAQKLHFLKNLSMLGGLLLAAADTAGRPSLNWRMRHAVHDVGRQAALVRRTAGATASRPVARAARLLPSR